MSARPASETAGFPELAAHELLSAGFETITGEPWLCRWDNVSGIEDLVLGALPDTIATHTSGTTGPRQEWPRTKEQLWAEAGLLADLLRPYRPEAVMSFAPPRHLYGALVSVLVPAQLGVPVWYRSGFFGSLPPAGERRWAVMAVPWIFRLLLEHPDWVRSTADLTVLHSTAMLPATAWDFLATSGNSRIVEVFGSTETGGVAHRLQDGGNPPWELFGDVSLEFSGEPSDRDTAGEVPLAVRSPRLAAGARTWRMDDFVKIIDDRRFEFAGRRGRLVKVNGRRLNLDELEVSLRAVITCADLAIVPVGDAMTGEHVDLLVVPSPGEQFDLAAAISVLGLRPRRVHVLDRIDRTETGKLRRVNA
ncbi:acyl-coenzyme A synthetase/AMP-(fatty) acid ligase [Kibdelosporangium banguiense]|uniref:Acyl-coenzyme A synthetase/AMP-(Fatty) acid ligase n=1 Tax=Kibdelosporangium banguiense TaxID=1365924 RepID=A0ABS4U0T0_9PSEU|nr:class I adenylate-forming enzyme family protein [Kibdelosporangium banguiense]MBP2329771.1 acyl-coenzyme A synthetase/AMP-(fatty) acid ligase [Kibdelosporangium banguiense]